MSTHQSVAVRFMLETDAAPGLLTRLLQPFARRDLIPDRMWSHRTGETLHVEIAMAEMPGEVVHLVEGQPAPGGRRAQPHAGAPGGDPPRGLNRTRGAGHSCRARQAREVGMPEADAVLLARAQFAFTIGFHIVLPALTIGLASYLAVLEALWVATGRQVYRDVFQCWLRVFAVAFGMGVVSGLVMAYEFGTNWAHLYRNVSVAAVTGPGGNPMWTPQRAAMSYRRSSEASAIEFHNKSTFWGFTAFWPAVCPRVA